MALTYKEGTRKIGSDNRISIASIVPNLNNPKEYLLIMAKDFVEGYTYQDYCASGFRLVKRY